MGIQPDFIIARSEKYLDQRRRDRFALFCNMNGEDILSNPDVSSVYEIPVILNDQQIIEKIQRKLNLTIKNADLTKWSRLISKIKAKKSKTVEIAIVGKYFGTGDYQLHDSYAALFDAIDHASWQNGVEVKTRWVDAQKVEKNGPAVIGHPDGIIVPIGWGVRGSEGMISAAGYARDNKIPYLGLCYGMQLAAVSFARDVIGWKDANTTENDPKTSHPVIHFIPGQEEKIKRRAYGGTMRLGAWEAKVKEKTLASKIYNQSLISERHRHRWEFNDKYANEFESRGMFISARSKVENLCEVIELSQKDHSFYFATQGHPEYKSRPLNPHPVFVEFLKSCKTHNSKS